MASFPTWSDWVELKEDNARKRAIRAALDGSGPPLPGSYAACPSTNPRAMAVAAKTGKVTADKKKRRIGFVEAGSPKPDYSFDRWVQMAQELGNDVNALVGHAKAEDDKLEKKKKDAEKKDDKKSEPEAKKPGQPEPFKDKKQQELLKKLKDIAKKKEPAEEDDD